MLIIAALRRFRQKNQGSGALPAATPRSTTPPPEGRIRISILMVRLEVEAVKELE